MSHSWCSDVQRDEAVRAAEDNRPGPLPTLAEAISRAGQFMPSEAPQEQKCTERENGLRTEQITLEVTHGESFGVSHWSWVTILRLQSGESVRVVEEAKLAPAANADGGSNHAAPAASGAAGTGWLTEEEREAVEYFSEFCDTNIVPDEWSEMSEKLRSLLARSSPPEVVLPDDSATLGVMRTKDVVAALAAAGVKVKEVGRE